MSLPDPKTRREVYLNSIANGESVDLTPHTREEVYLDAIANNGGGSGGGTTVVANPELAGTEADLTGLQVGETKYKVGGGGGVLIVGIDLPTMALDKTWQEIVDAGFAVIAMTASGTTNYAYLISTQHQSDFSYEVNAFLIQNGAISPTKFVATSADGYPVMSN